MGATVHLTHLLTQPHTPEEPVPFSWRDEATPSPIRPPSASLRFKSARLERSGRIRTISQLVRTSATSYQVLTQIPAHVVRFLPSWVPYESASAKRDKTRRFHDLVPLNVAVPGTYDDSPPRCLIFKSFVSIGVHSWLESNKTERSMKLQNIKRCGRGTYDDAFTNRSIL